ncbi:sensor histidine kinase [Tessaracoccus caeni]|uniref:sensor histidine kinase n=1 Tax=Tessaracoccus caeni TaxID=3031239 RepID=UPI0023DACACA|nr:histidine kinase [Tessaracoccus caeni]MDF1487797.1 histidine kinase [Tessaracoccus caeni]
MDLFAAIVVVVASWRYRLGVALGVAATVISAIVDPLGQGAWNFLLGLPVLTGVRRGNLALALVYMFLTGPVQWYLMQARSTGTGLVEGLWDALFWVFWFGVLWIVGLGMRAIERGAVARERALQQERAQRLAVDLHDTVSQSLAQLALSLETASGGAGIAPGEAEELAERARAANGMIRDVTTLLHTGNTDPLPGITLRDAIATGVAELRRRGFEVGATMDGAAELPEDLSLAAGAVVREALNNVLRHGVVGSRCVVAVDENDGELEISVINPFKASSAPRTEGLGIRGMQMRARLARGEVDSRGVGDSWICEARFPIPVR